MADNNRPDNISPVYDELRLYIKTQFSGLATEAQDALFAFAYAEYTREKKEFIARELKEGKTAADLTRCFQPYRGDSTYKRFCDKAMTLSTAMQEHTKNRVLRTIASAVSIPVVKAIEQLEERLNKSPSEPTGLKRFWAFIKESLLHAFHIVVAAVMIYALASFLIFVSPYVPPLRELGEHYIKPVLDALHGEGKSDTTDESDTTH